MDIETYVSPNGKDYVADFMRSLKKDKPKLRAKILRALDMLEEFGVETEEPTSKYVENGLFEIKAQVGKDAARVFYFFHSEKAILTNGYIKKTQKAPRNEIGKAMSCKKEYIERGNIMKFSELKIELLQDSETKKAYDEMEGEYQAMRAVHFARQKAGVTQVELSEASKVPQTTISRIESGNLNTTVNTLAKIAAGLGKQLKIEII